MSSLEKFISIKSIVDSLSSATKIIVVTKNFNFEQIKSIIDFGHTEFGENKVQEAKYKWNDYLINSPINLHLIGRLQSNKSKEAVQIFNYIHSLDSLKLAKELSKNEKILNKKVKYFVQINVADEKQKGGIAEQDASEFIKICINELNLDIIGLMCIPPIHEDASTFFKKISVIAKKNNLTHLSMGMSNDFKEAIKSGSTYVRIGSAIFGNRY